MSDNTTFIQRNDIQELVEISGAEIRDFLRYLADSTKHSTLSRVDNNETILSQVEPAIVEKVKLFIANPALFSDRDLVDKGRDYTKALNYPIRIEVRTVPGISGAAQIAVRGVSGAFREDAVKRIKSLELLKSGQFYIRVSGSASFEINRIGVDKALAINYLRRKWDEVLNTIEYKPGEYIDSRAAKTVVCADGDGTTFAGPSLSKAPTIKSSAAYESIVSYLKNGGIYVIISGNHLRRTISRVKGLVPEEYIQRLMIVANGGANMVYFDQKGEVWELKDYREKALSYLKDDSVKNELDMIYIGDDGRLSGNDREAFEAAGLERSILVAKAKTDDIIPALINQHIGGLEFGTKKVLDFINTMVVLRPLREIFTESNLSEMIRFGHDT